MGLGETQSPSGSHWAQSAPQKWRAPEAALGRPASPKLTSRGKKPNNVQEECRRTKTNISRHTSNQPPFPPQPQAQLTPEGEAEEQESSPNLRGLDKELLRQDKAKK